MINFSYFAVSLSIVFEPSLIREGDLQSHARDILRDLASAIYYNLYIKLQEF